MRRIMLVLAVSGAALIVGTRADALPASEISTSPAVSALSVQPVQYYRDYRRDYRHGYRDRYFRHRRRWHHRRHFRRD